MTAEQRSAVRDCATTPHHAMTGWYAPLQLLNTGVQVLISGLLGTRSDYRVTESFGPAQGVFDYSSEKDIWVDYVADVGDGWNSTYTLASLLARKALNLGGHETQRGRILIMGGDEVYPLASRDNYQEKLVAPYRCAHPHSEEPHPALFAIPGNHDWYDGLISFTRLFCQERWFGGWKTRQRRSYFAIKLPQRWWLWGVDLQLESDIDQPQLDYFADIAKQHVKKGDHIILATAEPDWIYGNIYDPKLQRNIAYLERSIIEQTAHAKLMVAIAGDLHHYRRHEERNGKVQLITAGGGGAFLHPTIGQRVDTIQSEIGQGGDRAFDLKGEYPNRSTSRWLSLRDFAFPFLNPTFGLLTGLVYLVAAWTFAIWSRPDSTSDLVAALFRSPSSLAWVASIVLGFVAFTDTHSPAYRYIAGSLHGLANVAGILVSGWIAAGIAGFSPRTAMSTLQFLEVAGIVFLLGYLLGSSIMGIYLFISLFFFRRHANEAFSALHIEDYKSFVRFHIGADGNLSIYPVGIRKVPRHWVSAGNAPAEGPLIVPTDREIVPFAIEKMITVPGPASSPSGGQS